MERKLLALPAFRLYIQTVVSDALKDKLKVERLYTCSTFVYI